MDKGIFKIGDRVVLTKIDRGYTPNIYHPLQGSSSACGGLVDKILGAGLHIELLHIRWDNGVFRYLKAINLNFEDEGVNSCKSIW